jgi:hypothetical protein
MKRYRLAGDDLRARILSGALDVRARRHAQYLWRRNSGTREVKRGIQQDVSHLTNGVLCLPGECLVAAVQVGGLRR